MEHTVHHGAKAFIEAISPSKPKPKNKQGTDSEAEDSDEEMGWDAMDDVDDGDEVDKPLDFDAGDVIGKVLALVNQVCFQLLYVMCY
jgi:hypothetical protein